MDNLTRRQFWSQIAVGLASFLTPFLNGALAVAMPRIGETYSLYPHELPHVALAHLIPAAALMTIFGRLSDRLGHKRIFLSGSVVFISASLAAILAPNATAFLGARTLQGIGDAMTFGVSTAILLDSSPPEKRGRALGFNLMFVYVGLALGPLVGGYLTALLSWRIIFVCSALVGAAACLMIARNRPPDTAKTRPLDGFDWRGAALYVPAMLCLIGGLTAQPSWTGAGFMVFGGAMGLLFVRLEFDKSDPLVAPVLFLGNRGFSHAAFAGLLGYAAAFSTSLLLSLYLQGVLGMSPAQAGVFLLIQPATQAVLSPVAGVVSDRFSSARVSALGQIFLAVGLGMLALHDTDTSHLRIALLQVLLGTGFSFFASPNINALMTSVDADRRGAASGLMATMRSSGMALSMALSAIMLALLAGEATAGKLGPEALPAVRAAFALFSAIALGSALVAFTGKGRE